MNRFIMASSQQYLGYHTREIVCVMVHNDEQHVPSQHHFHLRIMVIKRQQQRSAVICHRCEDTLCVRSCSNGAISHVDDSIQVNQQECIDCKFCVVACPFGTVQIVLTPVVAGKVKVTAHKYDLCAGYENSPICIGNCPADALQLVTDAAPSGMAKSRRLRTARQEQQPWHVSAVAQEMPVMGKTEQMQVTPVRGELDKLAIEVRKTGFGETYLSFCIDQAQREASRCFKCGEHSVCKWTRPLHNHIPQWIELARAGDIDAAVELSHQTNTLPEIIGRVYPQDRLCEGACTARDEHGVVTIGNIERYISGQMLAKGRRPDLSHIIKVDRWVAIIGMGPVGLACADVLTRNGVEVTVYDRHPEIGSLFTFGIPSFKLDKSLLVRRQEILSVMGIRFGPNCEVGKDVSLDSLLEQYGAVFVGVGTCRSMKAGLPNGDVPGAYDTLSSLIANTKQVMGLEELPEELFTSTAGLNVAVLGGGDTAMDCVRTALRHGASNITCVYRRDEANMSGSKKEVKNVREERANPEFSIQPVTLELNEQGHVCGTCFPRTRLGEPDAQGRRRPMPVEGSEFVIPADAVIMAFGSDPHGMPWLESHGITVDKWDRTITDVESQYRYQTMSSKIFAGGDAVCDTDLVVTAMAEGRHAAQGIIDWLGAKSVKSH